MGATVFHDKGKDRFRAYMYGPIPAQFNDPIGHYEIDGLELTGTVTTVQTLELFAGATWAFLDSFRLFLDMQHLSDLYQGTNFRTSGFNFNTLDDSDKLDDITLVNARLSYGFDYRPWRLSEAELFLAVNNIFDEDYEYAKGYKMPGTTFLPAQA